MILTISVPSFLNKILEEKPELEICFASTGSNEIAIVGSPFWSVRLMNLELICKNVGNKTAHNTVLRLVDSNNFTISFTNIPKQDIFVNDSIKKRIEIELGDIHPDEIGETIEPKLKASIDGIFISIASMAINSPFELDFHPSDKITEFYFESQILAENYCSEHQRLNIKIGTQKAFKNYNGLLLEIVDYNLVEYSK